MCLRIFMPTPRRLLLFLIFLVATSSGVLSIIPPFQNMFSFPYLLLSGYYGIIAQAIYSYIVACIYAGAYVWLEASIRKSYPGMNDIVQKKQGPPVQDEPLPAPEPPPAAKKPLPHRKVHARIKKAVKRRKR